MKYGLNRGPRRPALLLGALSRPEDLDRLTLAEWDLLLRQGAAANLLATLHFLLEQHGMLPRIPPQPREHLEWANALGARHRRAVRCEVRMIRSALRDLGMPLILLKGAAYAVAGLPPANGRLFSDIDILVPEERLAEVEAALMLAGWATTHHDPYDQRYYREWMHELPPMQHIRRATVIDVHHAILPKTAARRPDPVLLRAATVAVAGADGLRTLAPVDMVLHSATHLFSDGEFHHGLRDLYDLHTLLQDFGTETDFWHKLPQRAIELQLQRDLYYALRYCHRLLGTSIPAAVLAAVAPGGPGWPLGRVMDMVFDKALRPVHSSCDDWLTAPARLILYLRGNWLRMPSWRLPVHLLRKALISRRSSSEPVA